MILNETAFMMGILSIMTISFGINYFIMHNPDQAWSFTEYLFDVIGVYAIAKIILWLRKKHAQWKSTKAK
jgi:hypothetical protein